jgi:iron complex outermembrane receptor protein
MQTSLSCSRTRGAAALAACALSIPAAFAQGSAAQLPTVEVRDDNGSRSYRAAEAAGAKTELPLRELPLSVQVITRQAIDDLQATRLDDVLEHASGVSRQQSFGGLWDNFAIRGLPGNENTGMATLLNGFAGNRGFVAPRDLAGIERVEFLKGPAAALYGSSEPGGVLNLVSKRPLWKAAHTAGVRVGSQGERRATLDSTGPLGENLAYRLNVALEDSDTFRDFVQARREVVAPALTWKIGPSAVLEYAGEILRHHAPIDRGVVAVNNTLGAVPRERFLGEPGDGDTTVRNQTHQFVLSNELAGSWRSRVGLSLRSTGMQGYASEAVGTVQPSGLLQRNYRYRDWDSDDVALQAELQGLVSTGTIEHELLAGVEAYRFRMDQFMLRTTPSAAAYGINVFNPVYGQAKPVLGPLADTLEQQRGLALYLQDVAKLSTQWRLLAGVRVEQVRQTLENRSNASQSAARDPSAVSPRLGLSWLPTPQWTLYAQAGTSFRPNASSLGRSFDPERGRALELGAKWESEDQRLGASAALFDIRKRNVLTADPVNSGNSIAAGAVRSRGVEFDLTGQLTAHWRMNASLALHDVSVTRDNTLEVGGRLLNVPRVTASLLAMYEDALANGGRFGVGGGLSHVGKRLGEARTQSDTRPAFELPAYTTAKLLAYWRIDKRWRVSLDVDNLFDRTHYTGSYNRVWVTPGAPRTVTLGLQATL